jgi:PAS domain S-box-containing protein
MTPPLSPSDVQNQERLWELLVETANTYINLPFDRLDATIQRSMHDLGTFIGADRVYLFDYDFDRQIAINTHEWCAEGIDPQIQELQATPMEYFPDWLNAHVKGEIMHVPDVSKLPDSDQMLKDSLHDQGIQSLIAIPLMDGDQCLGFVGIDSVRSLHTYSEHEQTLLTVFGKMLVNVRKREAAQRERMNSERRFREVAENSRTVIWEVDMDGLYTYVSPVSSLVFGYEPDELVGKAHFYDIHPADMREQFKTEGMQLLSNSVPLTGFENPIECKDGRVIWVSTNGVPIFGDDGVAIGYRGADSDITDRKEAEQKILDMNQNLERMVEERTKELVAAREEAEKANMAKSEFLSRMSHELRTPMNSILGFAQLLELSELSPTQKRGVNHILKSGHHLLDLINEVLDISRIEAGTISLSLEPVDVHSVIKEMLDVVSPSAQERKITLQYDEPAVRNLHVKSDRQRLKQVLLNLINNAIKYNNEGGLVRLDVALLDAKDDGEQPVRISVADTGVGISESDLPKIFVPFERIGAERTNTEGTGLGLSVVKKLMDVMGGEILVRSHLGKGSEFTIELPRCMSQIELARNGGELNQDHSGESRPGVVLYIEDNSSNVELVEQILKNSRPDIRLITTKYGSQATPLAKTHQPDLILLDLNLPDMHGSDVLKALQSDSATHDIPVVVISADAMPKQIEVLLKGGAKSYLTKPLGIIAFLKEVDLYVS